MAKRKSAFDRREAAAFTAKTVLETGAVHFHSEADRPFIFTSGWASPVYIDCRTLISFPAARRGLIERAVALIAAEIGTDRFDAVAGYETAGIPFAAWVSDALDLPMLYVRKAPKGFARNALIEGRLGAGQRVLLIDDLATDGRSKVRFASALREAGAVVEHALVLFYYDIFPDAAERLKDAGIALHALATWADVLAAAGQAPGVDAATLAEVGNFLADPVGWSKAHGGVGERQPIAQPYASRPVNA